MDILVHPTGRTNQGNTQPNGWPTYDVSGDSRAEVEAWLLKHYDPDTDTVRWICDGGNVDELGRFYVEVDATDEFAARLGDA